MSDKLTPEQQADFDKLTEQMDALPPWNFPQLTEAEEAAAQLDAAINPYGLKTIADEVRALVARKAQGPVDADERNALVTDWCDRLYDVEQSVNDFTSDKSEGFRDIAIEQIDTVLGPLGEARQAVEADNLALLVEMLDEATHAAIAMHESFSDEVMYDEH